MHIKEEVLDDNLIQEITPLLLMSAKEVYQNDILGLTIDESNINFKSIQDKQSDNRFLLVVLRDDNKNLSGYISFNIYGSVQCSDVIFASCESVYIYKKNRSYKNFKNLLEYAENILSEKYNVSSVSVGVPNYNSLSLLLKRFGYKDTEIIMSKDI